MTKFLLMACALACFLVISGEAEEKVAPPKADAAKPADARDDANEPSSGEDGSKVQVGNLIYAGVRSSVCFSDHFLQLAETESSIGTSRRFHAVKSSSPELFKFPFVIMTGEGAFVLQDEERANLKKFLEKGGFLLASPGCSSPDWDRSFRVELAKILPDNPLRTVPMTHKLFKTVYDIESIQVRHGKPKPIEGIELNGRLVVCYSADGLNDTAHVHGCCCCGGNEVTNCAQINVNVLAYALTH